MKNILSQFSKEGTLRSLAGIISELPEGYKPSRPKKHQAESDLYHNVQKEILDLYTHVVRENINTQIQLEIIEITSIILSLTSNYTEKTIDPNEYYDNHSGEQPPEMISNYIRNTNSISEMANNILSQQINDEKFRMQKQRQKMIIESLIELIGSIDYITEDDTRREATKHTFNIMLIIELSYTTDTFIQKSEDSNNDDEFSSKIDLKTI